MFVVALVGMSTGEGGRGRIYHNVTLITPSLVLSASLRSGHSISMLRGTRFNARNGMPSSVPLGELARTDARF